MRINLLKGLLASFLILLIPAMMAAQGVTTSSINGKVTDDTGETLIGANVVAVHTPTGSTYGNITNVDGLFRIPGMRVGGPYTLTISYTGYQDYVKEDVYIRLGQAFRINAVLSEGATELSGVEIIALRNDIFDGNKTGSETTITEAQINTLPTVARSIGDFTRLTPQASVAEGSDGFSISLNGSNNRYNSIYLDGAVSNDVFGLAGSGTNGGQTGVSPISVDAIEEFQISLAPFDVRQSGFAGGAINAITRSGTNNFEGSAYFFFRNQALTRSDLEGAGVNDFSAQTGGFRVGGPIIKDKLFFFVNAELQRDEIPQPFDLADYGGDADENDLTALENKLEGFGYDPGVFNDNSTILDSDKLTFRLDYNVSQNHKLSFRHSYVRAENVEGNQSSSNQISYYNSSEFFLSKVNTSALELNSILGNNFSNNLILGYTRVRDDRDPFGDPFPYVEIDDGQGQIVFGSERFSTANLLDQDVFTLNNNFEIYSGKHTTTVGLNFEYYNVENLFIASNFGYYEYGSLDQFLNDEAPSDFERLYSLVDNITGDGSAAAAAFSAGQFGFYVQDEYQVTDNLKITGGIRFDIPFYESTPENMDFNNRTVPLLEAAGYDLRGARTGKFIDPQVMIAPRFGFNLDLTGEKTSQLRGGVGVFTSRVPLVWPGGAFNNNGVNTGFTAQFLTGQPTIFNPDINTQEPGEIDPNNPTPSGNIDLFASDFKIPQVWKANIAFDQKLPWGLIGNIDVIYNKTINNVAYQNLNIAPSNEGLDGTGDFRPFINRSNSIDNTYGRIIMGYNTSKGYTYNFSASLTKALTNGFQGTVAYSYGDAWSIFDGTSSQNSSQWRGLHAVGGRNFDQTLQRSDFSAGHRVIGAVSYAFDWFKGKTFSPATTFSFFWESQQGSPYSYIYNDGGSLNREDSRERNLIYIPLSESDIFLVDDAGAGTAAEQWTALDAFIESDDYLSENRGQYAARNASRSPWSHVLDARILQDFNLDAGGKKHTLQFSFDIFNLTNLISESWGRRRFVGSFGNFELLNFEGFTEDTDEGYDRIPTFTFDGVTDNDPAQRFDDSGIQSSRWQMQIGIRYIFK